MREQIRFGLIRTPEEFEELKKFAKSFDHHVGEDSLLPIYTARRGGQLIGYFNVLMHPIACPAIDPNRCTPRDFYELVQYVKNFFCMNSISAHFPTGTCFMAFPLEPKVERDVLDKCGFVATKKEIWQAI